MNPYRVFMVLCGLMVLFGMGPANSFAADVPVTKDSWTTHPQIREVRDIYREIKKAMDSSRLSEQTRRFEYCEPYEDILRTIYREKDGTARMYRNEAGSDDSAVTQEFYYGSDGTLRFVFVTAGAVNGTRIEHRIYFNAQGKKIWEIQKNLEGPGYTFPRVWPDDALVHDPLKAFNAPSPCPMK